MMSITTDDDDLEVPVYFKTEEDGPGSRVSLSAFAVMANPLTLSPRLKLSECIGGEAPTLLGAFGLRCGLLGGGRSCTRAVQSQ